MGTPIIFEDCNIQSSVKLTTTIVRSIYLVLQCCSMSETGEIGPTDASYESSIKRFEARQEFKQSPKRKVISAAKKAERTLRKEAEQRERERKMSPTEKRRPFNVLAAVKQWLKES